MLSPLPPALLTLLSLCTVVVVSLPLSNSHELSANRYVLPHLSNGINRENRGHKLEERIKLPIKGTVTQLRKKRDAVKGYLDADNVSGDADDELMDQLDELELAILGRIVQDQLDRYNPDLPVDEYEIVKMPRSSVGQPASPYIEDIGNNENDLATLADEQPKIVLPIIELPEDEVYEMATVGKADELPKYVLIPAEEVITMPTNGMEDDVVPIDEDALNDLELRSRIAILANALNERATRGF